MQRWDRFKVLGESPPHLVLAEVTTATVSSYRALQNAVNRTARLRGWGVAGLVVVGQERFKLLNLIG
jgi:hypothetical protein